MNVFSRWNDRIKAAKAARQKRALALEAEARELVAERGRIGALRALDDKRTRAIGRPAEQTRIADLVTTIFRLTPAGQRAKMAAHLFQTDLAGGHESAAEVATRVRETLQVDPLTESLSKAVGAIRVEGPDETGLVVVFLNAPNGSVIAHQVGKAGVHGSADAWLAWRDDLA